MDFVPAHPTCPPDAEQAVALVVLQRIVVAPSKARFVWSADITTVGCWLTGGLTGGLTRVFPVLKERIFP